jgi:FkbH-like protein
MDELIAQSRMIKPFSELKKNLKNDCSGLKTIRVALLGDTPTQLLAIALRGAAYDGGFNLEMWEADFNQVERQVFDPNSALHLFNPEIIFIFQSSHKLLEKYNMLEPEACGMLAQKQLMLMENLCAAINTRLNAQIICYNYNEIDDAVFGSFGNKVSSSFIFQLRKLNFELMEFAAKTPDFYLCDLSSIQNQLGKAALFQPSVYVNSEMVLSIDVLPQVAYRTIDMISAIHGKFKKCVVFDLDNTIWGGIIGDDGLDNIQIGHLGIGRAFTEFQHWLKKLKNRGIILAVCSKNTEAIAREPFEKHPDMVLRLDDIAVFVANWDNKVDNLLQIKSVLNISFDAMVYLDDSPFERDMVRQHIPHLTVPELPNDPADYLEYLYSLNLFETASLTPGDAERTRQYQSETLRSAQQLSYVDEDAFLQSLGMVSAVEPFNSFNTPRVAQLSQRSNQFNLRTVRYSISDIERLASSPCYYNFTFTLEDKFGDNGLVCVVILKKETEETLFIDTWMMSCRVLNRGMENFVLNTIVASAAQNGFTKLKGEYLPTAKNEMVKCHYAGLDFKPEGDYWVLGTKQYVPSKSHIIKK